MARKVFNKVKQIDYVDTTTGEIISQEVQKEIYVPVKSERFYQVYLDLIGAVYKKTSGNDYKVLSGLMHYIEFGTYKLVLSPARRKELCTLLDLKMQTVTNSISNLKKQKIIVGDRFDMSINPMYVWFGSSDTRRQALVNENVRVIFNFVHEKEDEQ